MRVLVFLTLITLVSSRPVSHYGSSGSSGSSGSGFSSTILVSSTTYPTMPPHIYNGVNVLPALILTLVGMMVICCGFYRASPCEEKGTYYPERRYSED